MKRPDFIAEAKSGAFDGVVAVYHTFGSGLKTGKIDDEVLAVLPPTLKFIAHNGISHVSRLSPYLLIEYLGAGYDSIDIEACTAREICVSNTPTAVNDATADITMFLILGALRNLAPAMLSARRGEWRGKPPLPLGHNPRGKILGILGMGGIGRNVADKARAFGMKIRYNNRKRLDPEHAEGAEYVDFETLLKESDVLSVNVPLNASTRHLISTEQFSMMKDRIVVINTARGAVIDEDALVEAIDAGKVASAGLDVFEDEPRISQKLLDNDKVLIVPHMGTYTVETELHMEEWTINNIESAVTQNYLITIVPEQRELEKRL